MAIVFFEFDVDSKVEVVSFLFYTSHLPSPIGRRTDFANTTTVTRTANCSPALLRLWRSADVRATNGYNIKRIKWQDDDSSNDITADRWQMIRRHDGKPRFHGLGERGV